MRITLMHNPKAGNGRHGRKQLLAALNKAGHRVTYQSTNKKSYKKALKKPAHLVLIAGGDGTVTKVGRAMIDSGVPLAVLPLGTANNVARTLGFTDSIEKIIKLLKRGKKHPFDVGLARGPWGKKYFLEGVGSGLFADYVRKAASEDKKTKKLSKEQELTRHVRVLRRMLHNYRPRKWKVDIDHHDASGRYILWEAMNIRSVGPALYLAPPALIKDGHLEFVTAKDEERSLFIKYLDSWLAGRRKKFPLRISRCRKLKIVAKNSGVHIDGKIWPKKNRKSKRSYQIDITVKPSALIVLQPPRR
jgi:diacylglycerol kinase (ATP)